MTKKNLNCVLMVKMIWHSEIEVIHGGKRKGEDEKMEEKRRSDNVRCMRALEAAQNPEEMLKEQWVVFQVKYKDVVGLSVAWSPSSGLVLCVLHRCHQPGPHVR